MKIVYKLTDQNMKTHNGFQWELGKTMTASGAGELCGPGWLHCYSDPLLAVLLNPIHANIKNPRLFRAEVKGRGKHDRGLKSGYASMTLVEEIPLPEITTEQTVKFGILCSLKVYREPEYVRWAERWLSGENRTALAAEAAARAAAWVAEAAARTSAWVARAAAWAARAARAAEMAQAQAAAAAAAAWAAEAAAGAARAVEVAAAAADIDLVSIAQEACAPMTQQQAGDQHE